MQRFIKCLVGVGLAMAMGCDGQLDPVESSDESIIHGDVVPVDGYPTVGMVMTIATASRNGSPPKRGPLALCTGTLISPTAVLLAAHCVDQQILSASLQQAGITISGAIEFRFTYDNSVSSFIKTNPDGTRTFDEKPSLLVVATTEQMPINIFGALQRPGKMDDIAVLKLAHPVKGKPVQALATPEMVAGMQMGSAHAVAGYGQTSNVPGDFNGDGVQDDPGASAGTLHSGVSKLNQLGANELIAGNMDPQQACHGDSGGPIFLDGTTGVQMGIASRINAMPGGGGAPLCEPGLLYTRVDAYLDWIHQHVPDLGQATAPCAPNDTDPSCAGEGNGHTGDPDAGTPPPPGPDAGTTNPGDGDPSSGCGCTVGGQSQAPRGALVLLLVGAAVVVGRRRRRR